MCPAATRRPFPAATAMAATRSRRSGGCTRPTIPSAGSGSQMARPLGDADGGRSRVAGLPRARSPRSRDLASPWGMPWISARLREPDGCPWDREQTHASLRNHLLEEAYEVYDALDDGATPELAGELGDLLLQVVLHAQLAAEAGRVRHDRRLVGHRVQDRPPAPARVRRCRGAHRLGRQPPVGADQGGGARRGRFRVGRWRRGSEERPRRHQPLPAGAGREPGDAGARRRTWATTGRRSTASWTRCARRSASWSRPRTTPTGPRSWATCCSSWSTSGARPGSRSRARCAAPTRSFAGRFRHVELAAAARDVALRDLSFEELDALWDAAKAAERGEARTA